MINLKNLIINDSIASFDYKIDNDEQFEHLEYDLKNDKIISSSKEIKDVDFHWIYHGINKIKDNIKKGIKDTDICVIWY